MKTLQDLVTKTYARHYRAFKAKSPSTAETDAWNATLDEMASKRDFPRKEERFERRRMIASGLHSAAAKIALRHGDPYRSAVHDAMLQLKVEGRLVKELREAWRDVVREAGGRRKSEDLEVELYGYIMFDRSGRLQGWTIEHAQYFRGHAGPTAVIPVGGVTWKDVEDAISEELAGVMR